MRLISTLFCLTLLTGCAALGPRTGTGDGGWRLIYASDAAGRALAGDKQELTRAVRAGLPVRVGWGLRWEDSAGYPGGIEHVAEAGFVSLYKGEVFAQLPAYARQRPDQASAEIEISADGAQFIATLDTTGRIRYVFQPGGERRSDRVATYWYVPWRTEHGPAAVDVPSRLN